MKHPLYFIFINFFVEKKKWQGKLPKGYNVSFITIIPKVDTPQHLKKYRSISLSGAVYIIISNVLANRMKKFIPKVIDKTKSVCLVGRNLLDCVLIANEVINKVKSKQKNCLIIKVNFKKALNEMRFSIYNRKISF